MKSNIEKLFARFLFVTVPASLWGGIAVLFDLGVGFIVFVAFLAFGLEITRSRAGRGEN